SAGDPPRAPCALWDEDCRHSDGAWFHGRQPDPRWRCTPHALLPADRSCRRIPRQHGRGAQAMMLDAALDLARRGFHLFPLAPRSKAPTRGGHGALDATRDAARIRAWWGERPDANIGLATGPASGLYVVDIDPAHGGNATMRALVERHGR